MQQVPDVDVVLAWCRSALEALGDAREEIDAVNVFPVADSDTGTNLYLTLEAAVSEAEGAAPTLADVVDAIARGAFGGARGNSGTILAQVVRGLAGVLGAEGAELGDGTTFARGLRAGVDAAYAAVGEPVEGTMLTVAQKAADAAADRAASDDSTLVAVVAAATDAAHRALERTPTQLDVLRRAGVVDAGGMGVVVLLDALESVLTGRRALVERRRIGDAPTVPRPFAEDPVAAPPSPAYEVMYLLDAAEDRIDGLRARLRGLGDSVVIAGGGGEWNVHVHTDDAGAAVEAGLAVGRPRRLSITYLASSGAHDHPRSDGAVGGTRNAEPSAPGRRRVVAVAAGDGIAELFAEAGATVVRTRVGHRPSGAELVAALRGDAGDEIVILPNEREVVPVAEAAAAEVRAAGFRAAVIPTVAQVQGLAALAVHEPARAFDADVVAMTTAAGQTRHGGITVATSDAVTSAGVCAVGDVLGVVDGDFAVIGADPVAVAVEVVGRMLAPGGELVTLVTGADDGAPAVAEAVVAAVRQDHPEVDVVVCAGDQPRYPLLLGVE